MVVELASRLLVEAVVVKMAFRLLLLLLVAVAAVALASRAPLSLAVAVVAVVVDLASRRLSLLVVVGHLVSSSSSWRW